MIKDCIQAMKEALITLEDELLMIEGDSMDSDFNVTQGCNGSGGAGVDCFTQDGFFTSSLQMCERVNFQRHLCRMTLQLCAIMSQTNQHLVALDLAVKADQHARKMISYSQMLCSEYLKYLQYQNRLGALEDIVSGGNTNLTDSHPAAVNKQEYEEESDYAPTYSKD